MTGVALSKITAQLDALLCTRQTPDYPNALNGLQVEHCGPVTKIAAAVDASAGAVRSAIAGGANLLIVHHGIFWSGLQSLTGPFYSKVRLLLDHVPGHRAAGRAHHGARGTVAAAAD